MSRWPGRNATEPPPGHLNRLMPKSGKTISQLWGLTPGKDIDSRVERAWLGQADGRADPRR
jgi:hypothetical protein